MKRIINPILLSALIVGSTATGNTQPQDNTLKEIKEVLETCIKDPSWSELLNNLSQTSKKAIELFKDKINPQLNSLENKIFNVLCAILSTPELIAMGKFKANHPELPKNIIKALCEASIQFISLIKSKNADPINFVIHIEGQARSLDEIEAIVTNHIREFKKAATSYKSGFALPAWLAGFVGPKTAPVNENNVDQLLATVADELLNLIQTLQKQIDTSTEISNTVTEIKTAAHTLSDGLDVYKAEFSRILQEALEAHLSVQEVSALVEFLQSSAYQKIKTNGLPKLLSVMGIVKDTTDLLSSVYSLAQGTLLLFKDTVVNALKSKK